jgi:diacylglycerol kinase family enzyme
LIPLAVPGTQANAVLIVNECARGTIKRPEILRSVIEILSGCKVFSTRSVEALSEVTQFCLERDSKVVALYGGDGTLSCALTKFFQAYEETKRELPVFAPLLAGTMNTVVKELGLRGDVLTLAKALKQALEAKGTLHFLPFEPLALKEEEGDLVRLGFLAGIGLPSSFLGHYYTLGAKGPIDGLKVVLQLIGSILIRGDFAKNLLAPLPVKVMVDQGTLGLGPVSAALFGKVKGVGLKAKPLYFAPTPKGLLAYVATDRTPSELLAKLGPIFRGLRLEGQGIAEGMAASIKIASDRLCDLEVMVDGDTLKAKLPLFVSPGPSVRLFNPIL